MANLEVNKALQKSINWIKNNKDTEKILSISKPKAIDPKTIVVPISHGEYPRTVEFTAMQQVMVTYKNKYFGIVQDTIVCGFDAREYQQSLSSLYKGNYLGKTIISIRFVGECATIINTINNREAILKNILDDLESNKTMYELDGVELTNYDAERVLELIKENGLSYENAISTTLSDIRKVLNEGIEEE